MGGAVELATTTFSALDNLGNMFMSKRHSVFLAALVVALLLPGCGPDDGLADVRGTVTLNGEPLPNATIEFQPLASGESSSVAKTDADGRYRLMYTLHTVGAVAGEHRVTIQTAETCFDESGQEYQREERVPARYNRESTLRRTVEPGKNTIHFDL